MDEKSVGKGHRYVTLVCDLSGSTTDMWDPYFASIREFVPLAEEKIVFDRYHLMTHMGKAVDTVRKREHGQHYDIFYSSDHQRGV